MDDGPDRPVRVGCEDARQNGPVCCDPVYQKTDRLRRFSEGLCFDPQGAKIGSFRYPGRVVGYTYIYSIEEWFGHVEDYTEMLREKEKKKSLDQEGVRLMTIHAAKGLEFDSVFLIEANEGSIPYRKAKTEGEIEEERRLFYVAMTRAKELLKICYVKTKNGKEVSPSRFVEELFEN